MRALLFTLIFAFPFLAGAHTLMNLPIPRAPDDGIKTGPCGPYVKPAVANPANTYMMGSEIDVHFTETINHTGYFWVDLAMDDAALTGYNPNDPDPLNNNRVNVWRLSPAPPLNFVDDNIMSGFKFERRVTLPAGVTCENCTLRIVQYMEGRVQPYYYTCSDIKIQAEAVPTPTPGDGGENSSSSVSGDLGTQSQFGGCGSIDNSGGPGGPTGMAFILLFLFPLALVYAGKRSPITVRR